MTASQRPRKERAVRAFQRHMLNPVVRRIAGTAVLPTHAVLETTGRKSGLPRRNPVGNGLKDDTFWIVAEHGARADYVRNIANNPRVRVKVGGQWRSGTAQVVPDDDPRARLKAIGRPVNAAAVRMAGTDLLTVRIDLDP